MTTSAPRLARQQLTVDGPPTWLQPVAVVAALGVGASARIGPAWPLVLAVAGVFLLLAWQRPALAGATVVGVVPALSGVQRGFLGALKLSELVLVVATVAIVLRPRRFGDRLGSSEVALVGFALLAAALALVHTASGTSSVVSFVRFGLQPALLFLTLWVVARSVRSLPDLRLAVRTSLLVSVLPATLAVAQAFDVPGVRSLLIRLTAGPLLAVRGSVGLTRATGPFPIWHSLAAYLLVVLAVAVALLLHRDQRVLSRTVLLLVIGVDVAALVLSLTVAVIVWAVVAVLVVAVLRGRLGQALGLIAVTAGVAGVLFAGPIAGRVAEQNRTSAVSVNAERSTLIPQTIAYRISVWRRDYVPLLERAIPYGLGNELPETAVFQHAENQYILLVLRGGALLLVGALGALLVLGRDLLVIARRGDEVGVVAGAALAVLIFLPAAGMVWPYLSNAGFPQAFFALAGAALGASRR